MIDVTERVGYALRPKLLIFLKGGVAWKREKEDKIDTVTGPEGYASVTRSGGLFGGGVEYEFTPHWSAFIEGDRIWFGKDTVNYTPVPGELPFPLNIIENMWMVVGSVNYRFNVLRP